MSMTSRTSGTRRLERAAAWRIISFLERAAKRESGGATVSLVYSAFLPVITRNFGSLPEIHGELHHSCGSYSGLIPLKTQQVGSAPGRRRKMVGCCGGWCGCVCC